MATELVKNTDPRKGGGVVYNIKGLRGNIYFPDSIFEGVAPDTLQVDGASFVAPGQQKTALNKMSPEERKAAQKAAAEARKNMTPLQKAEAAKVAAEKAAQRAAKLAAAAAAAAAAQPQG